MTTDLRILRTAAVTSLLRAHLPAEAQRLDRLRPLAESGTFIWVHAALSGASWAARMIAAGRPASDLEAAQAACLSLAHAVCELADEAMGLEGRAEMADERTKRSA